MVHVLQVEYLTGLIKEQEVLVEWMVVGNREQFELRYNSFLGYVMPHAAA
jgi:hypothetical protein